MRLVLVAVLLAAGHSLTPDITGVGYYDNTPTQDYHSGLPPYQQVQNSNQVKFFLARGAQINQTELFQLHRDCVDRINEYRVGTRKYSNGNNAPNVPLSSLAYLDEAAVCLSAQAMGDIVLNVYGGGYQYGVNFHQGLCPGAGEYYDVGCYPTGAGTNGPSDTATYSTYAQAKNMLNACIQEIWDEGQTSGSGWRYDVMSYAPVNKGACGFAWTTDGRMTAVLRFQSGAASYGNCDCTGKSSGQDAGCGGALCVAATAPTPAPVAPPSLAPTKFPTKAPTTRTPTKTPTPPTTAAPTVCTKPPLPVARDVCMNGYILDCRGVCWYPDQELYDAIGNGQCNQYLSLGIDVNCPKFCCDGGDCTCP